VRRARDRYGGNLTKEKKAFRGVRKIKDTMVATASDASTAAELPSNDVLRWMFEHLVLIREFEERVAALRQSGVLQGSAHLYVGQEAVAVGVCARLNKDDYVASTHRGAWARHRQGCRRGAHDGRALRPGHGHE